MLNSPSSKRYLNLYTLDTAVKPNYNDTDYAEDANTADIKWNVYVILLLRRRGLIKITEMTVDPITQNYMIQVAIENDLLLKNTQETVKLIDGIREDEWRKNESDFQVMSTAVRTGEKMCWSEMFFDTYSRVSVYCAGCDNHGHIINEERNRFKLLKTVDRPVRTISTKVASLMGNNAEAVMLADAEDNSLFSKAAALGFDIVVLDDSNMTLYMDILLDLDDHLDINFMGITEYTRMLEKRDYYYVSGAAIVLYDSNMSDIYRKLSKIRSLSFDGSIKLLHVFEKNLYFSEAQKDAVSMIDGPVLEEYDLERV